jgi:hypothetical protein
VWQLCWLLLLLLVLLLVLLHSTAGGGLERMRYGCNGKLYPNIRYISNKICSSSNWNGPA